MRLLIILIVSLLLIACNEVKPNSDDNLVAMTVPSKHRVCKKEQTVGSHFSKKVCRTLSEIKKDQYEAREFVEEESLLQNFEDIK